MVVVLIVDLVLRGMRDTTKCTEPYIVYLMAPETHSTYCPSISEAPRRAVKNYFKETGEWTCFGQ